VQVREARLGFGREEFEGEVGCIRGQGGDFGGEFFFGHGCCCYCCSCFCMAVAERGWWERECCGGGGGREERGWSIVWFPFVTMKANWLLSTPFAARSARGALFLSRSYLIFSYLDLILSYLILSYLISSYLGVVVSKRVRVGVNNVSREQHQAQKQRSILYNAVCCW